MTTLLGTPLCEPTPHQLARPDSLSALFQNHNHLIHDVDVNRPRTCANLSAVPRGAVTHRDWDVSCVS